MAFRGQHEHSLDSKDRVTIPAKLRAQLAGGVVLAKGLDHCVDLYPTAAYDEFADRFLAGLNPLSAEARKIHRRFDASAEEGELDSAGRVRIPAHLIEHAGLAGKCMVVGVRNHLEIWDADAWRAEQEDVDTHATELAEGLAAREAGGEG